MTRPLPHRARALAAAGAALLALGALAGCSAHPGDAAVVTFTSADGSARTVTITQNEVDRSAQELSAVGGNATVVVNSLASLPVVEPVLAAHGVTVTDADVQATADSFFAQQGLDTPDLSATSRDVLRYTALTSKAGQLSQDELTEVNDEVTAAVAAADVQVSPRYAASPWIVGTSATALG